MFTDNIIKKMMKCPDLVINIVKDKRHMKRHSGKVRQNLFFVIALITSTYAKVDKMDRSDISFSGWQSVDINFFKMFRSCLFKSVLIEIGNKTKRCLWDRPREI